MSSCQGCGKEMATHGSDCIEEMVESYEDKIDRLQRVARVAEKLNTVTGNITENKIALNDALNSLRPGDLKPHDRL